jgi:hypothetical protein
MKFTTTLALVTAAGLASAHPKPHEPSRALYFLNSDPEGASIISFEIAKDGSLGEAYHTSTGGKGLIGQGMNGPVSADPLFSQGSVVVSGNHLFTVNAGSNTLAVFHIPEDDAAHPVLLSEPVDTVGTSPNTVAYSKKHKLACVANTGNKPGVQCFKVSPCNSQLMPEGGLKPLPIMNQTNPIMGPANTVSQILFNPSETALFVSMKGNGMDAGYVYAYKIENGKVAEEPVTSRPEGVTIAFGMSFVSDSQAVISSPSFGGAFVSIAEDLSVSTSNIVNIANQSAVCWTVFSEERNSMYMLDAGVADLTTLSPETMEVSGTVPGSEAGMGNLDGIIGGNKLYALQNEPAIAVYDLDNRADGPELHTLDGMRAAFIGMAIYYPRK